MLDFNAINLVYGFFNQFVFPEAKMNINYLRMYFDDNHFSSKNTLIPKLLSLIEGYKFQDITEATFINVLVSDGKSDEEVKEIIKKIKEYKGYTKTQAVSFRDHLQRMCYSAYINRMKYRYDGDEVGFVRALQKFDYKSNYSDTLLVKNFNQLDITDLVERYSAEGLRSRYKFVNDSFTCKGWIPGQIVQVCAAPSCFVGSTEVFARSKSTGLTQNIKFDDLIKVFNDYQVIIYNPESSEFEWSDILSAHSMGVRSDLIRIDFDDNTHVVCTADHKFLTKSGYKKAEELTDQDEIMSYE